MLTYETKVFEHNIRGYMTCGVKYKNTTAVVDHAKDVKHFSNIQTEQDVLKLL